MLFNHEFANSARSQFAPIVSPLAENKKIKRHAAIAGRNLLTRGIDLDPFDLTIKERIIRGAERVCTIFAVAALTIGTLDLMNFRPLEAVAGLANENHQRLADLSNQVRSGIDRISPGSSSPSVVIEIPQGVIVAIPRDDLASILLPVAALDITRDPDAVEDTPPPTPQSEPMKLASIDPSASLVAAMPPEPMQVALPMQGSAPPLSAPGVLLPSPAERLRLEGSDYASAERCLAKAIYFEARSEPERGQMAVAQVVMNRVFSGFYPNDICGVVYQNAERRLPCQFTFACDGKRKTIDERDAWARAIRIAKQTLDGQIYVPEVAKSTHYHAIYVHPNWVREMKKMVRYGVHNFYRPFAWGDGADEPVWGSSAFAADRRISRAESLVR